MAIRKSTEEDFEIAENVEALLKRCSAALEAGGFKSIKVQELTSTIQADYKKFSVWGEISCKLFTLADNRTKISVKATANYDNIYALFSSPNQKILRSFRDALNGTSSPVSSESGKGFQWKWVAIAMAALVIIGAVFGKPKNASSLVAPSGEKAVEYQKGANTTDDSKAPVLQTTPNSNSGNSSYPIEPEVVALQGRLVSAPGETPDGAKVMFRALQLAKPITVGGDADNPVENGVKLMQLVMDGKTNAQYEALKDKAVSVKGTLSHRDNGNQRTPVLMTAIEITPTGE